jgi:Family of unknown function (DUF5985)
MPEAVYLLCAGTSIACAALLLRGYRRQRTRLLLWSSLCFVCLAINNILLFLDLIVVPATDLSMWRAVTALLGVSLLLFGLIWESR